MEKFLIQGSPPLLEMYPMGRYPRGMCIIFNIEIFNFDPFVKNSKRLSNRPGSSQDRDKCFNTFSYLGFKVEVHNDLKAGKIVQTLIRYSQVNHSEYDCFVCVILSHGERDHIYGSDGVPVPIRSLTDPFKSLSCPGLCGKPKMFFIQACQGLEEQQGQTVERDAVPLVPLVDAPLSWETIPNEHDFLIGMATVPGFVSYRNTQTGSWYIQTLCDALNKYAGQYDIHYILTYVNREVGKLITNFICKQSPAPLYTLRKLLYLPPKPVSVSNTVITRTK